MELKGVQKSVRLTPRDFEAISVYRGEGFNEKLHNLLEDYLLRHDQLVQDWNLLQAAIVDKRTELKQVQSRLRATREVNARLGPLVDALVELLPSE